MICTKKVYDILVLFNEKGFFFPVFRIDVEQLFPTRPPGDKDIHIPKFPIRKTLGKKFILYKFDISQLIAISLRQEWICHGCARPLQAKQTSQQGGKYYC
jgi:hypothetical protein